METYKCTHLKAIKQAVLSFYLSLAFSVAVVLELQYGNLFMTKIPDVSSLLVLVDKYGFCQFISMPDIGGDQGSIC